ncbi:TetR/AcrR family transcriptional regulator [Paenibacillus xylaniclasticus]|uniref:TetR/AcrR family transcriptional regulator n=1 Tax=Paenibacillus xylaniclasticus TaxID=588083 RepID=UPI0013DE8D19|nr:MULTISPECIES: TetR/AcrR family transcriptional regulator [Paenibacillus]GFN32754.1 TetR family transcriptional regulator [Paenibacillus curdlanolyticus]
MNDTALRIKQAALRLFTEYGFEGTSLSDIAQSVGIKTPSIYAHYKSKEQLFIRLVEDVIAEEWDKWLAYMAGEEVVSKPAKERLRMLFHFFADFSGMSAGQSFLKRTILMPPRGLEDRIRADIIAYEETITRFLRELLCEAKTEAGGIRGTPEQEERQIAVFFAFTDGLLVEFQLYDPAVYRKRVEAAWEFLWEGIIRGG